MTIQEIIDNIIKAKTLNTKNNNYVFLGLDDDQMKELKQLLFLTPETITTAALDSDYYLQYGKSSNMVIDCQTDKITNVIDSTILLQLLSSLKYHFTVNLLNFQVINDHKVLQTLNKSLKKGSNKICYNLFTTDSQLKEYFTKDGLALDHREDVEIITIAPVKQLIKKR